MADGNLPIESTPQQGGILSNLGRVLSDATFPEVRKNFDLALGRMIGASGEFCATAIENETDKIKARKDGRVDSIRSIDKAANAKNLVDEQLVSRAANFHAQRTIRQQKNREAIFSATEEEIVRRPPQNDARRKIDDDWLEHFARHAETITADQMQRLWSRILAGEVKNPGSFNLRTMDFISKLNQDDAKLIERILPYADNAGVIPLPKKLHDTHLEDLLLLEEMGLVSTVAGMGGLEKKYEMKGAPTEFVTIRFKEVCIAVFKNEDANSLRIPVLRFSSSMVQLMGLCDFHTNRDHVKSVAEHIRAFRLNVKTGYAIEGPNNLVQFFEADI